MQHNNTTSHINQIVFYCSLQLWIYVQCEVEERFHDICWYVHVCIESCKVAEIICLSYVCRNNFVFFQFIREDNRCSYAGKRWFQYFYFAEVPRGELFKSVPLSHAYLTSLFN